MSDIKVFVYDTCGKKEEAVSAVEKAGMSLAEGNDEEALLAADFLLLSTADARELDEKEAADKWNFFLDELRWKRKENGEIRWRKRWSGFTGTGEEDYDRTVPDRL